MMAGRYAHAKQSTRPRRQLRVLRTRLGRLIRDIRRKIAGYADLEAAFVWPLARADQIRSQQQRQRGWKLYSFHAPEVECIGKGKASAPYEFGVKASVVTANARAPGGQLPRPPHPKPASRLHVRAKTRRVRPHQTRAQTTLRDRGGDWTYESRRSPRPLLPQRSRRRCRQRHPQRRRL